jgi:Sulfite exporter TauE/SafE
LIPEEGDIEWTPRTTLSYPAACSFAGVIAGMFGVGGGIVKGPLMLHLGVLPEVAAATSATMILFTSCACHAGDSHRLPCAVMHALRSLLRRLHKLSQGIILQSALRRSSVCAGVHGSGARMQAPRALCTSHLEASSGTMLLC